MPFLPDLKCCFWKDAPFELIFSMNSVLKIFMIKVRLLPFIFLISVFSLQAQNSLKSPSEFLGYEAGERFTYHHRVLDYFRYMAANSQNVQLKEYGTTYENRPLLVAYVGTEENLQRLEEIKANNRKRTGLQKGTPQGKELAVIWLSYNVHGNEAVSTEASMEVLYRLAAGINEEPTESWLNNSLIIIDPVVNPDGRERYVNWFSQKAGSLPNPDPDAWEHHEPWPGGRPNHYLFDLNRDWAWQTQKESQLRMTLYNEWLPHIHADFHEQGIEAPYYFAPAAEPFHSYITDWQREFQTTIGLNNTKYFDEEGWLYFTRERFDLFYPGYGDTYPIFNGAIGMTFEQGGSGRAGVAVKTAEGDTLKLRERIKHHVTTSLATIEATSVNAERVLENFQKFFTEASENPPGTYKSYLISGENERDKLKILKQFLDLHEIQYGEATEKRPFQGWNYQDASKGKFRSNPGDIVIQAGQPKGVLLQVMFEPNSSLSDSVTYDITAWSVPYMMGLKAFATTEIVPSQKPEGKVSPQEGIPLPAERPYAYIQEWKSPEDVKFLARLIKDGIKVRYAEEPFVSQNRHYQPGTLIITRKGNEHLGENFDFLVRETALEWDRQIHTSGTGFVAQGKDFGSESVRFIKSPNVAVMGGKGVESLAFGEVWHFFEQQIGYPLTVLSTDYAAGTDLGKYDVLIFPAGSYKGYLNQQEKKNLADWINRGGRLIIMEEAISSFQKGEDAVFGIEKKHAEDTTEENKTDRLRRYKDRERESLSDYNPGSIYRIALDNSHPLAFGYSEDYFSLKTNSLAFDYLEKGWNVGTIRDQESLISGFIGSQAKEEQAKTLVFGVEEYGKGEIIYMVDNPLFRGFWQNGKLLFSNAVFLVGQ